jgi:hypothetical protein
MSRSAQSDPSAPVYRCQDSFDFIAGEEPDHLAAMSFLWDGQHSLDETGVLGQLQGSKAEKGADGRKPQIAGSRAASAFALQVVQKCTDQRSIEILHF